MKPEALAKEPLLAYWPDVAESPVSSLPTEPYQISYFSPQFTLFVKMVGYGSQLSAADFVSVENLDHTVSNARCGLRPVWRFRSSKDLA